MKFKTNHYGVSEWQPWIVWPFWILMILLVITAATVGIRTTALTIEEAKCAKWQQINSEQDAQFVEWNYFDWDCLVTTDSGVQVPVEQYRISVGGK